MSQPRDCMNPISGVQCLYILYVDNTSLFTIFMFTVCVRVKHYRMISHDSCKHIPRYSVEHTAIIIHIFLYIYKIISIFYVPRFWLHYWTFLQIIFNEVAPNTVPSVPVVPSFSVFGQDSGGCTCIWGKAF